MMVWDASGERLGGSCPVAQGHGHRDDPLPRRHPGDHLLDETGGHLRYAPAGTGGTKPSFLTNEGQQHPVRTGVTPQAHEAMGQNPALQIRVIFLHHVLGEAFGGGIGGAGGQEGLQMLSDHLVEDRPTGVSRLMDRRYHMQSLLCGPLMVQAEKMSSLHRNALWQAA